MKNAFLCTLLLTISCSYLLCNEINTTTEKEGEQSLEHEVMKSSTWLPSFTEFNFNTDDIYITLGGIFSCPVILQGEGSVTSVGGGFNIEGGYQFQGWSVGLEYKLLAFGSGSSSFAKDIQLNQNIITLQISKYIDNSLLSFLPKFLAFRPEFGVGVAIVNGHHTYNENNYRYEYLGASFTCNVILTAELVNLEPVTDWINPFFSFSTDMFFDKAGLVPVFNFSLGARTDIARLSKLWRK